MKTISCIYTITNKINNKVYVGYSKNVNKRFRKRGIYKCLNNESKKSNGYIWKYESSTL